MYGHKKILVNIVVERTDGLNVDRQQQKKVMNDLRSFLSGKGYAITEGSITIGR